MEIDNQVNVIYSNERNNDSIPVHVSAPKPGGQLHGYPGLQMNHYGDKCEKCGNFGGNLYYNGNKRIYTCGTCG